MGGKELNRGRGSVADPNFLCSECDGRANQAANETDSWEWDHSCNTGNVIVDGKYLGEVDTLLILMGSKEDTLQSTLNKGDPKWECYKTVFCGVMSRDTIVVRSRGFLASPRK